jgi:hypothetical protein
MGPSGKYILEFHRTFRWLPSSAARSRHVQAMPRKIVQSASPMRGEGLTESRRAA